MVEGVLAMHKTCRRLPDLSSACFAFLLSLRVRLHSQTLPPSRVRGVHLRRTTRELTAEKLRSGNLKNLFIRLISLARNRM
jgi:hypothetical protein